MKRVLLRGLMVYLMLSPVHFLFAQTNEWIWQSGDSTVDVASSYGIKGIPSSLNKPGARSDQSMWTDKVGNIWIFGGYGLDANDSLGVLNDLWRYDPLTKEWTWMAGDTVINSLSIYGSQNIPSPVNTPGGRGSCTGWVDNAGNLWLFGGQRKPQVGFISDNDLWKYDVSISEWIWVGGDTTGMAPGKYGVKNVPSTSNKPGARYSSTSWLDAAGDLWLFGGNGYGATRQGMLNDLWKYNLSTAEWTWISGDSSTNSRAVYGIQGVSTATNKPGGRQFCVGWIDLSNNLWLFGGNGYNASSFTFFMDLWKYNTITNEWVWMKGDTLNRRGTYGIQGVPAATNRPGSRTAPCAWKDKFENFWLFGGQTFSGPTEYLFSDLWKYQPQTNNWVWVRGDSAANQEGVYGIQGVSSPLNNPGARSDCSSSIDSAGRLWLFGGGGKDANNTRGNLNDLWTFPLDYTLPLHLLTFTAKLQGNTTHLRWTAANEINFDRYEVERSSNGRDFVKIGMEKGKLRMENEYSYADDISRLMAKGSRLYYRLKMVDKDGSFTYSKVEQVTFSIFNSPFSINPNPVTNNINIQLQTRNQQRETVTVQISDVAGKVLIGGRWSVVGGRLSIPTTKLVTGTYVVKVVVDGKEYSEKVVVMK